MSPTRTEESGAARLRRGPVFAEVVDRRRGGRPGARGLEAFLVRLAAKAPPPSGSGLVLCLLSDAGMRRLNRTFRGRRGTTDVLAFPGGGTCDPDGRTHLGDIAVSVPRAASQARERGHSLGRELRILAIHGYLHLLGHDHEKDRGEMRRIESRLVRALLPPRTGSRT